MKAEPHLKSLETCWQMRGPSGKVFECALYRTDVGLELRVGYDVNNPVSTAAVTDIAQGRARAAKLKGLVLEQSGFEELPG